MPNDIAELFDIDNLRAYVRERILRAQGGFDPDVPVDEHGRQTYSSHLAQQRQTESEFWFVRDESLKANLIRDWMEARNAYAVGATKACVILCGGILEGLFLDALSNDVQQAQTAYVGKFGKPSKRKLDRWDIGELAEAAQQLNLLSDPTLFPLSDVLRQWRDLVHPGRELRTAIAITKHKAATSINTVATWHSGLFSRCDWQAAERGIAKSSHSAVSDLLPRSSQSARVRQGARTKSVYFRMIFRNVS